MSDSSSVNVILDYLKSNNFSKSEAALLNEIDNLTDLNGLMQELKLKQGTSSQTSDGTSKEAFVVKEMEYGAARNGSFNKWNNAAFVKEQNGACEPIGTRKFSSSNGSVDLYPNDVAVKVDDVKECQVFTQSKIHPSDLYPRLTPVKLKSDDKHSSIAWEEKYQRDEPGSKTFNVESTYLIGSFLDVPIGQEISSSGGKRVAGGNWFSVSQGITEDTSDLVSGFATIGDGLSEYVDYPNDYWDSDEYDDDDDVGYMRQPIEDETWFLAHEIDYPSDNEKKTNPPENTPEKNDDDDLSYLSFAKEELNYMHEEPMWKGVGGPHLDDLCVDEDQHGSVRSIGVGINSDVADFGSERELDGTSSHDSEKKYIDPKTKVETRKATCWGKVTKNLTDGGFSFPPPRAGQLSTGLNKGYDPVASEDEDVDGVGTADSSPSTFSNYGYAERAHQVDQTVSGSLEDEEAAAFQEQMNQIKAQEEEYETFDLKIVHRKKRTGFEEDKNFNVVINSVIAGRYHVTEYLGSAAFSKAIQAHDLQTGMDVCVKIIKNNKDFFDQSLDEIKLLKFINKHDPSDKYHLLRLYDYFYYREHLLIVCELLKANLYEFHKFNRESGGEVYFTMPRLQSITIQCLEALEFLHGLGLIHCDLKPENILVKSYSRCEVKVIDLGSSCFETDHLCSYVQSRSYRAPEVILGLPYDKKIDIWSLGCILAELCTGYVLFQNDSPATLLARVIGIISPISQDMLAKGRDTYKYFSKNNMLYERNQDTNRLEYLIPKKTSLRHRLPMGDQGFIDFVSHLLEISPKKRPSATEALRHPWLSYPYEPISS
ncbi:putative dual-specificity kinase CMGC-DYRK-PRP4 family [Helianthus annuus]|nr:putative dual-specificity kinase CMGC-DYRK-PRP4 family [Helianthus annuus]